MKNIKRNTLAVRLDDKPHEDFISNCPGNYSPYLRAMIELYNEHSKPSDDEENMTPKGRVEKVLRRIADAGNQD